MPRFTDFDPMDAVDGSGFGQIEVLCWDFTNYLANLATPGITLTGTPNMEINILHGVDAAATSRILVSPTIGTSPLPKAATNAAVLATLGNFPGNALYLFKVWCPRSDGKVATAWNYLRTIAPDV